MLVEIARFSPPFGSFFLVPTDASLAPDVCSNGNITFVTPVDPLFAMLILIDCHRKQTADNVFQPLDAICATKDGNNLSSICKQEQFACICDVREAAGQTFYRLNNEKVVKWLLQKHEKLNNHPNVSRQDATDILSQYLLSSWETNLKAALKSDEPKCVEDSDSNTPKSTVSPTDIVMAAMLEEARKQANAAANNHAFKKKPSSAKKPAAKTKKKPPPSASALKFWSAQQKGSKSKRSTRSSTRAKSSSGNE